VDKKAYGGRSKTKWILIYVVIAVVVYAIAYVAYKHFHHTTTGTTSGY
jgi:flagellar basal body-associated protein FliL